MIGPFLIVVNKWKPQERSECIRMTQKLILVNHVSGYGNTSIKPNQE